MLYLYNKCTSLVLIIYYLCTIYTLNIHSLCKNLIYKRVYYETIVLSHTELCRQSGLYLGLDWTHCKDHRKREGERRHVLQARMDTKVSQKRPRNETNHDISHIFIDYITYQVAHLVADVFCISASLPQMPQEFPEDCHQPMEELRGNSPHSLLPGAADIFRRR